MHQKSNEQDMLRQFNMECQSSFPERELLNSIALQLINKGSRVTHKSLILQILTELELEKDNKKKDLLRSTLEMVVGGTPDDEGF
ncbi:biofilm development regulator YmgB/AriR family protein [Pantoea rodasii]|nr:biofilm development regulator YmgB/AriR family protein [Pantoea rodasii]